MPITPEFIPISKGKQMLFLSSWRDAGIISPHPSSSSINGGGSADGKGGGIGTGGAAGHGSHSSSAKVSPSLSVLRTKEVGSIAAPPPPTVSAKGPSTTTAAPVSPTPAAVKKSSGRRRRDRRGGVGASEPSGTNHGAAIVNSVERQSISSSSFLDDVVDYFLYLSIPPAVHREEKSKDNLEDEKKKSSTSDVHSSHGGGDAASRGGEAPLGTPTPPPLTSPISSSSVTLGSQPSHSSEVAPPTPVIQNGITSILNVTPALSPEELVMELKSQANPLHIFLVGPPRMIFAKKIAAPSSVESLNNAPQNSTINTKEQNPVTEEDGVAEASPSFSRDTKGIPLFQTPALRAVSEESLANTPELPVSTLPASPSLTDSSMNTCASSEEGKRTEDSSSKQKEKEGKAIDDGTIAANGNFPYSVFSLAQQGESFSFSAAAGNSPCTPGTLSGGYTVPLASTAETSTPSPPMLPPSAGSFTGDCFTSSQPLQASTSSSSPLPPSQVVVLPPGIPQDYQIVALFAEESEALQLQGFLKQRFPIIQTKLVPRSRSVLNASLVLKGLPSLHKSEIILEELQQQLCHKPSYVRLHRSERGVFKNVMFIKYPHRGVAEDCKLILERFYLGSRPLKVEFKKKSKMDVSCAGVGTGGGVSPSLGTTYGSSSSGTTSASSALANAKRANSITPVTRKYAQGEMTPHLLEKLIRELRISNEHEGVRLARSDLRKEDLRELKQLCKFYGMRLDLHSSEQTVTVLRDMALRGAHLGGSHTVSGSGVGVGVSNPLSSTGVVSSSVPKTSPPFRPRTYTSSSVSFHSTESGLTNSSLLTSTSGHLASQNGAPAASHPLNNPTKSSNNTHTPSTSASNNGSTPTKNTTSPPLPAAKSPRIRSLDFSLPPGAKSWREAHLETSVLSGRNDPLSSRGTGGSTTSTPLMSATPASQKERLRKAGLIGILRCPGEEGGSIPFPPGRGRPV